MFLLSIRLSILQINCREKIPGDALILHKWVVRECVCEHDNSTTFLNRLHQNSIGENNVFMEIIIWYLSGWEAKHISTELVRRSLCTESEGMTEGSILIHQKAWSKPLLPERLYSKDELERKNIMIWFLHILQLNTLDCLAVFTVFQWSVGVTLSAPVNRFWLLCQTRW